MIYPIYIYGSGVLRKECQDIDENYPELPKLIEDMFATMYATDGVGLAAPQIGKDIRLFVVDGTPFAEDDPTAKDFKKVFINPVRGRKPPSWPASSMWTVRRAIKPEIW